MTSQCVVLGGSGFIGQILCSALVERGFAVRSLSRSGRPAHTTLRNLDQVDWVEGTVGSTLCNTTLRHAQHVFHLASTTLPASSNDNLVFDLESNTVATLRMLEHLAGSGARLYFLSSGGTVYGIPTTKAIAETHSTNPVCAYGIHKLTIEKYLYLLRHQNKLASVVLRPSNIYGETQDPSNPLGAILHFVCRAINRTPIEIWGDGSVVRDYMHVEDVVSAILAAIPYHGTETVFNVGSGQGISLNNLLHQLQTHLGRPLDVRYSEARTFDVPINVLDTSLALRELDWHPRIDLAAGLSRMIAKFCDTATTDVTSCAPAEPSLR